MRSAFLALERRTTALAMALACTMLAIASCLGMYQILARFVFLEPAEWSEVLIRFSLIWMVFLGAPMAFRQGAMVCVDLAHRMAGARGKRILDFLAAACALVILAVMLWFGTRYSWVGRFQTIAGLETVPMSWAYLSIPVGAIFSCLAVVACFLDPRRYELVTQQ